MKDSSDAAANPNKAVCSTIGGYFEVLTGTACTHELAEHICTPTICANDTWQHAAQCTAPPLVVAPPPPSYAFNPDSSTAIPNPCGSPKPSYCPKMGTCAAKCGSTDPLTGPVLGLCCVTDSRSDGGMRCGTVQECQDLENSGLVFGFLVTVVFIIIGLTLLFLCGVRFGDELTSALNLNLVLIMILFGGGTVCWSKTRITCTLLGLILPPTSKRPQRRSSQVQMPMMPRWRRTMKALRASLASLV